MPIFFEKNEANYTIFLKKHHFVEKLYLVGDEPTPLKDMLVKMGSSSPSRGENKKIFETTT